MLGGLSKKSTYLEQYRKEHGDIIVVDSGDLLNEYEEIKESVKSSVKLKADLTAQIYKMIGIDAINVGELDLVLGLDYLKELEKKYELPFVSANLVNESNELVFKPYVIKKIGNKRIGIFGLMGDSTDMASKLKEITGGKLSALDPVESAESMVKELKGKADFIIAMTHQHIGRNWVIARKVEGIDVIVGGHHTQKLKKPYQAKNTFMVQAGEKGQYQGMLEVILHSDGSREANNELVPLGPKIPDDPKIKAMIDNYNEKVTSLYFSPEKKESEAPLKMVYCEDCHSEQVSIWRASDHARAFETLAKKYRQFNPDCLACHTTRFEKPGGFNMTLQQAELRDVQCDSCHGNTDLHLKDIESMPYKKLDMESCMKCHTSERCPDFEKNFQKIWAKIKH